MKKTIEWHDMCLKNQLLSIREKKDKLISLEKQIEKSDQEIALYAAQIDLARKERKDGFDRDKYAIKRLYITQDKYNDNDLP